MEFKIGQKVKCIDSGKVYSTYDTMAEMMKASGWSFGNDTENGAIGKVITSHMHETNGRMLYLVEFPKQVIIDEDGLEPVSDTPKREFKEGDRVRINKCTQGRHTGMIGVVFRPEGCTPSIDNHVCLQNEEGNTLCCYSFPEDLELTESPEREEVKEEEEEKNEVYGLPFKDMLVSFDLGKDEGTYYGVYGGSSKGNTWNIPSPKKVMASLKTIASKLLDADIKALVKAGWLDEELELTPAGTQAVLAHVLLANKVELAKEARKLIKAKKNCEEEE